MSQKTFCTAEGFLFKKIGIVFLNSEKLSLKYIYDLYIMKPLYKLNGTFRSEIR